MGESYRCLTDNRCDRCAFTIASAAEQQLAATLVGAVSLRGVSGTSAWAHEISARLTHAAVLLGIVPGEYDHVMGIAGASLWLQANEACPPPEAAA